MTKQQSTILIVDDILENVNTLFHFLDGHGFEVLVARDGKTAIELVQFECPHLILLDVMMPGMDGFETCRRLKEIDEIKDIPVIFMTALVDTSNKVKGFQLGAVDYVTKPIQQEEVLARIKTHLTIHNLQQQLQAKNTELETKNVELAVKNSELKEKNAELDAFSHTVAHDLKNPLSHLISMSDLLMEEFSSDISPQAHTCLQYIFTSSQKMIDIINALLLLASVSKQTVKMEIVDMDNIIVRVQQRLTTLLKQYQGDIIVPDKWPVAIGYAPWVEEVWANYLSNGLKYGGQPSYLEIGATVQNQDTVRFWVRDNGPGLSQEAIAKLFTPFTRLHKTVVEGHGLGLSIVQRIVKRLGGEVGVESQLGAGSVFYFTLKSG